MVARHQHDDGWTLGYERDEDPSPAMLRHERRYGHEVTNVCRHHGRLFTRDYCETCGKGI